jgi:hypothetical protein
MAEKTEKVASTIYKKLLEFQKLGISIKKSESNPHFKSKYPDISEVLEKVKKPLSDLGVVLTQIPDPEGLTTVLHDTESATEITGRLAFIGASDPQKLGSNITYYRRYALVAMLGLEDYDEDGNVPAAAPVKAATPAPKPVPLTATQAMRAIASSPSLTELTKLWTSLTTAVKKDPEVLAMKDERKEFLTNQEGE